MGRRGVSRRTFAVAAAATALAASRALTLAAQESGDEDVALAIPD